MFRNQLIGFMILVSLFCDRKWSNFNATQIFSYLSKLLWFFSISMPNPRVSSWLTQVFLSIPYWFDKENWIFHSFFEVIQNTVLVSALLLTSHLQVPHSNRSSLALVAVLQSHFSECDGCRCVLLEF